MRLGRGQSGYLSARLRRCFILASAACALMQASSAQGQDAVSPPPPGRLLASNCFQCHGPSDAAPGFDKLTGKSASKLYKELKKFRSGGEGENIMAYHARGFTDAQLRELTQWLSMHP